MIAHPVPDMTLILDFLREFEPMEWLTIGLMMFAGVQVLVPIWSDQKRQIERTMDREREDDLAYQFVWAEHFRLDSLAEQWGGEDLVFLSVLGVLSPAHPLPGDPSRLLDALARLGVEAGFLGGVASTLANDISLQIASLNAVVADYAEGLPEMSRLKIAELVRKERPNVVTLEDAIRATVAELAKLLWDASRHSPRAEGPRTLVFKDDMLSEIGRKAAQELSARAAGSSPAAPRIGVTSIVSERPAPH